MRRRRRRDAAPPAPGGSLSAARGVVLLVIGVVLAAGCAARHGQAGPPPLPRFGPSRVAFAGDFGDPFLLNSDGTYMLFGTDDPPDHVPTATSSDLVHWRQVADAVPVDPAWADPDPGDSLTWAPAALHLGGRNLLYVTVQDAAAHRQCVAVLAASAPTGPYRDARGSPLVCQAALGGSIDPSVVNAGGGLHLVWKSDGNCCGRPASLWEQDLSRDGLAVTGSAHRLLTADQPWQGGIVENPALIPASGGGWWLFYSGNRFNVAAYATGLAWCPTLAGPCRETSAGPFLAGTATQFSPGGVDFFHDAGGHLWAAFATWNRPARNGVFFCCHSVDVAPVVSS